MPVANPLVVDIPANADAWTGNVGNFSGVETGVWSGNGGQVTITSHFRSHVSQFFLGHHNFLVAITHAAHAFFPISSPMYVSLISIFYHLLFHYVDKQCGCNHL